MTLAMSPSTAAIRSMPVVASSSVASVKTSAMITPDRLTATWSFFQPRVPASAVFRGGPFAFADYRESRAVDDEVHGFAPWDSTKGELEVLAAPRERRMIGRGQIEPISPKSDVKNPSVWRRGRVKMSRIVSAVSNREVGAPQLPAPPGRPRGLPGRDGGRREPDRDVASSDEGAIVGGPVLDAVFRLVRGMDSRLHPPQSSRRLGVCETSRQCWSLEPAGARIHAPTPLKNLAEKTVSGELGLRSIGRLADDEVTRRLTTVWGIGAWTTQMFLIFKLGRPDVMPAGDLGVQKGLRILDGLDERPTPELLMARSEVWRPLGSVAAWFLWRLTDKR